MYGFIIDGGGRSGLINVSAPSQCRFTAIIKGKAAHAGLEPEKGVSAVQILTDAVSGMQLGRIDHETTANIGTINGGSAINVVCDCLEVQGEVRSINEEKMNVQISHIGRCFRHAADSCGGEVEFSYEVLYKGFSLMPDHEMIRVLKHVSEASKVKFEYTATGGVSDANIANMRGIPSVNICPGTTGLHSTRESIHIEDLSRTVRILLGIIEVLNQRRYII